MSDIKYIRPDGSYVWLPPSAGDSKVCRDMGLRRADALVVPVPELDEEEAIAVHEELKPKRGRPRKTTNDASEA